MPVSQVVINSSPLITLFASDQQNILPALFNKIIVPEAVWDEVIEGGHSDIASSLLPKTPWLQKKKLDVISATVMSWDLGKGESEVITYANLYSGYHVIIDDSAARKCAKSLGVYTLGTLGVLLLAKHRGVITEIKPAITALQEAGLWLGEDLINMMLNQAGES